jgi:hypothetical protein
MIAPYGLIADTAIMSAMESFGSARCARVTMNPDPKLRAGARRPFLRRVSGCIATYVLHFEQRWNSSVSGSTNSAYSASGTLS